MTTELETARAGRDAAWNDIQRYSAQRTKGENGLRAARAKFRLACDEVRGLESDLLVYPDLEV